MNKGRKKDQQAERMQYRKRGRTTNRNNKHK